MSAEARPPSKSIDAMAKTGTESKKRKHVCTESENTGASRVIPTVAQSSLSTASTAAKQPQNLISEDMQLIFSQIVDKVTTEIPPSKVVQTSSQTNEKSAPSKSTNVSFTKEQDARLLNAVEASKTPGSKINWFQISQSLNRSAFLCQHRLQQLLDPNYTVTRDADVAGVHLIEKKGKMTFTEQDDDQLRDAVSGAKSKEGGRISWEQISRTLNRSVYYCKQRWQVLSTGKAGSQDDRSGTFQTKLTASDNNADPTSTGDASNSVSVPSVSVNTTKATRSSKPSITAASQQGKIPPPREFSKDEIVLILQAGHEFAGAERRVCWEELSRKFKCTIKDCKHEWDKLQAARKKADNAMKLFGKPAVTSIENTNSSTSTSSSNRGSNSSNSASASNEGCLFEFCGLSTASSVRITNISSSFHPSVGSSAGMDTVAADATDDPIASAISESALTDNVLPTKRKYSKKAKPNSAPDEMRAVNTTLAVSGTKRSKTKAVVTPTTTEAVISSSSSGNGSGSSIGDNSTAASNVAFLAEIGDQGGISTASNVRIPTISSSVNPSVGLETVPTDATDDPIASAVSDNAVTDSLFPAKRRYTKNACRVPNEKSALNTTMAVSITECSKTKAVPVATSISSPSELFEPRLESSTSIGNESIVNCSDTLDESAVSATYSIPATKTELPTSTNIDPQSRTRHVRRFTKEEDEQLRQYVETTQTEGKILVWAEVGRLLNRKGEVCQQRYCKFLAPGIGTSDSSKDISDCVEVDKATAESYFKRHRRAPQRFTDQDDAVITEYMEAAYTEHRRVRWSEVAAALNRTTHACKQRWHGRLLVGYAAKTGVEYEAMSPVLRAIVADRPCGTAFSAVQDYTMLCAYDAYVAKQSSPSTTVSAGNSRSCTGNSTPNNGATTTSSSRTIDNEVDTLQPLWDSLSSQLHQPPLYISGRCSKLLEERDGTAKLTTLWTIYNQMCSTKLSTVHGTSDVGIVVDSMARAVRKKVHDGGIRNSNCNMREVIDLTATDGLKSKQDEATLTTATTATTAATELSNSSKTMSIAEPSVGAAKKKTPANNTVVSRNIYNSITYDSSSDSEEDNCVNSTHAAMKDGSSSDSSSDSSDDENRAGEVAAGSPVPAPKRRPRGNHSPGRKHGCNKTSRTSKTFTPQEDALIVQAARAVTEGKLVNWLALGKALGRMGCVCRRRWVRHLSKRDDTALAELQEMSVLLPVPSVADSDNTAAGSSSGHIFAVGNSNASDSVVPADSTSTFLRTARRTFTEADDAQIIQAVRTAVSEGRNVVWKNVGGLLDRTGQSCRQRWVLTLAPRNSELQ